MNRSGSKMVLLVTFMLLGMILAFQYRSIYTKNQIKAANALNVERLSSRLNNEKKREEDLEAQFEKISSNIEEYLKASVEKKDDSRLLSEYEALKVKAGLTNVEGPGIIIKLDDAPARAEGDLSRLIIHDADIRIIVNELKSAGAEAISINGERIVSTSEIFCAGPNIIINSNRYPVPYIINAIGDPDVLYDSLSKCERVALMLEDNIRVVISKNDKVSIPKYNTSEDIKKYTDALEVVEK